MQQLSQQVEKKQRKTIRPLFDRILLEPLLQKQAGKILVHDELAKQSLSLARVVACGPGKLRADTNDFLVCQLKPGDLVYINPVIGSKVRCPVDMEFVVEGAGEGGNDLVLDSGKDYQLQTEESIYMRIS
jgi:co-chaperonin GroES (HSP10)